MLHKLTKFYLPGCVCFPSYSIKCASCFTLRHLMTSWHLNIWKFKIWLSQEQKELSKWNKKHFSLFHKSSLLGIQNKLVLLVCFVCLKERTCETDTTFKIFGARPFTTLKISTARYQRFLEWTDTTFSSSCLKYIFCRCQ